MPKPLTKTEYAVLKTEIMTIVDGWLKKHEREERKRDYENSIGTADLFASLSDHVKVLEERIVLLESDKSWKPRIR